jgi:hypothetical protein
VGTPSKKGSWQRPDGEELIDAMSVARCARELSCGFYYRWRWPRKEPTEVIERWLKARKEWHKELREKLKGGRQFMDSPLLCAKAAIRWYKGYVHVEHDSEGNAVARKEIPPKSTQGPLPVWPALYWQEWEEVRDSAKPETEPVWVDRGIVQDVVKWLREPGGKLAWYEFKAVADEILRECKAQGVPVTFAGPGQEGDARVISLTGSEAVVISARAHGTGKNLQQFCKNLVITPFGSGSEWEQVMGRCHRTGQSADEVLFEVYGHTEPLRRAIEKARDLSQYIEETFGASQRLASVATWRF